MLGGQGMPGPWVVGWIDSWSLSPLLVAGDRDGDDVVWRAGESETIGQRTGAKPIVLDLLCHSMPLTVHVSSQRRMELTGYYCPTGQTRDGTQVLERGGGTGIPQTMLGPLYLTYHHTPPANARWMIVDDPRSETDALAFHGNRPQTRPRP